MRFNAWMTVAAMAVTAMGAAAELRDVCGKIEFEAMPQLMKYGDEVRTWRGRPFAKDPTVIRHQGRYLMYYSVAGWSQENCPKGERPGWWHSGIAESSDLVHWRRIGDLRIDFPKDADFAGDLVAPCVKKLDGKVHLFAQGHRRTGHRDYIWHATSEDGVRFTCADKEPMFSPRTEWSDTWAIDAEVYRVGDSLMMMYATREPSKKEGEVGYIQRVGLAKAKWGGSYAPGEWTNVSVKAPVMRPQEKWEMSCIEAPTVVERKGVYYLLYAGAYNHERQQIGAAWSLDGVNFRRFSLEPVFRHGGAQDWNAWESGHPGLFQDDDGQVYLFYQGKATLDGNYYLSCSKVKFVDRPQYVIAHTGCDGTKMNSLESVRAAIASRSDLAEFDLNVNAQGELVISHDRPKGGEPTVDAALAEVAKSPTLRLNIDCKNKTRLEEVPALVKKHGLEGRFFFTGVADKEVPIVKAKCPGVPYLLNVSFDVKKPNRAERANAIADQVKALGGIGLCMHFSGVCLEIVEAAHERGLVVSAWTPQKEQDIRRLLDMGCDYVTSRDSKLARRVADSLR